ncbi:2'-5'-oligoadenylate synthase-like protein 2 [Folsomia candida]|nr:2'-5'-oligoadenylate synthase-like protein 2 [Folsomia candida]
MLAALGTVPGFYLGRQTRYSISFQIRINRLTLDFDLLPATNMLDYDKHAEDMAREQAIEVRRRMQDFANPSAFSSSLAEQTILFMKNKPDDIVKVIKLARYWNQQIEIDEYVKGRSYMIELVACWAQKGQPACNLFTRFVRFLREMEDFSNLRIFFGHHYRRLSVPDEVWEQTPLVMDPCNLYNNLAEGISQNVIGIFEYSAARSLGAIRDGLENVEDLFQGSGMDYDESEYGDDD